jgi:hypothetical protein
MGVGPGDAAYPFMQGMLGLVDRLAEENAEHRAEMAVLLERAQAVAADAVADKAVGEVARSVDRLVLQRYRWAIAGAAAAVVLALGAGVALDRYVLPSTSVPVAAVCAPHQPGQTFACTMQMQGD